MRTIVFLLVTLAASPACAEMLLIQIHQTGSYFDLNYIGEPLYIAFGAESAPSTNPIKLEGYYDIDDVGMTFHATPEAVAAFELALTATTGQFWLSSSQFPPGGYEVDELWRTDLPGVFRQFVPRLGYGLTGYDLTAVTQTIDRIVYMRSSNYIVSETEQTIRIYGQVVPEPTSLLLVFHSVAFWLVSKRCRQ